MKYNLTYCRKTLNELNNKLFNGELVLYFPIKYTKSRKMAASIAFKRDLSEIAYIGVSTQFEWNEQEIIDCLAHELVHVYELQIAKVRPSHSGVFEQKMNEINSKFNDLTIKVKTKMPYKKKARVLG